jgi:hypothetical protein
VQTEVAAASVGQRRVHGDARSLARELVSAAEAVLYARLDEGGAGALSELERAHGDSAARAFDSAPWRELARSARGEGGGIGSLSLKLVEIAGLALSIEEDQANRAAQELARAEEAAGLPELKQRLASAEEAQAAAQAGIEQLLERLAEWDNFQSVLGLTRDILNGQRNLSERTRQSAREK